MTEVFTGLPEQDVLLTEFFLEKFLWRHTLQEFFLYVLKLVIAFFPSAGIVETSSEEINYWV